MLRLRHISLVQFKNYDQRSFAFSERVTGICGRNGVGKTNLLDAIHYLCFTRSYFTRLDGNNVQRGTTGFRLEGDFSITDKPGSPREEKAVCILRENGRKEFLINDTPYDKFSQHIGRYPCVVIAPDDAELITGESRKRRSFLDALLSQLDAGYLQQLIHYKKILEQRNSLLKSLAEKAGADLSLLEVLDAQLVQPGEYIFNRRKTFLVSFLPHVKQLYHTIAGAPENITLLYESELLEASFTELLQVNRAKDIYAQRTSSGIHRDDLEILSGNQDFKSIASQGQRKSLLFALKLAEMEALQAEKGFPPLLLLDDVFEKLDEDRISNLLNKVCVQYEGQVFITDTNKERLRSHLDVLGEKYQLIEL